MSSWSSYPPPPRRSRSRSPTRGGYSGRSYPDSHPDGYRDWEYERERWAYERDRIYDFGRRGRSRSPPVDEPGRKRRRSMSPYDRERYDPRPRYSDDYDAHSRYGYASSPRRHSGAYAPSRRAPPDPHTFEFPATLKQYAEWFRFCFPVQAAEEDSADKAAEHEAGDGSKPRNGIKSRWEKYKKDFAANQLQTMFEHHRKSPWFAERYDPAPEFENLRLRVRKEGWKGRLNTFLHDLESGKFDPDLNEPELDPSSPTKDGAEGTNVEGVTPGEEPKPTEDDIQFNVEADDDDPLRAEANGKSFPDKRNLNRGEEVSVSPEGNQVMIRTIPPDIGRVKLEEFLSKIPGFLFLALGDPLQKRNYYRAGWIRFQDDADMATVLTELSEKKIEGFKLHVTHNTRPFTNKTRCAPEVASRPDRLEKDLENARVLASLLEDQAAKLRAYQPSTTSGEKANGSVSDSNGDATMASPEDDDPEPKERGSDAVERRVDKIMTDLKDQGLIDVNVEKAYYMKKVVVSLDMYHAYLRAAFHTCYYCAVVTDHLEELQRKCVKHIRKPLSKLLIEEIKAAEAEKEKLDKEQKDEDGKAVSGEGDAEEKSKTKDKETKRMEARDWKRNDERWLEWLDSKTALLINRDGVDPRDYGGKSYEEELSKAVEPSIKQEDEGKFRCKTCQKLFKATSFVEKHIANKHPELVKQLDDLSYFNNFALDPHRIQPFAHPPPVVGNNNQPPPQAFGIQVPVFHVGDYGRGPPYYGNAPPFPPGGYPPYHSGYWEGAHLGAYSGVYPPTLRRDEGKRLSDRISGFVPSEGSSLPTGAGLPPKPRPAALDSVLASGNGAKRPMRSGSQSTGGPPPPPPDAKEDPRAAAGKRISYHDMDLVAEGDIELMY